MYSAVSCPRLLDILFCQLAQLWWDLKGGLLCHGVLSVGLVQARPFASILWRLYRNAFDLRQLLSHGRHFTAPKKRVLTCDRDDRMFGRHVSPRLARS